MAEPHVITALRRKRAELAGEVVTAQLRLGKLRDDLDAIDRTLRVFDPSQHPEKIRPIVKRRGARMFAHGECTRAILNALRDAPEPMTVDQVAEQVALDCRIATEAPDVRRRCCGGLRPRWIGWGSVACWGGLGGLRQAGAVDGSCAKRVRLPKPRICRPPSGPPATAACD
jgi:hypothetical protein